VIVHLNGGTHITNLSVSVIPEDMPAIVGSEYSTDQSNNLIMSAYPLLNSRYTGFEFEYWVEGTVYP